MTLTPIQSLAMILVIGAVTLLIRACPFLIFRGETPKTLLYLGEVLPYAIMAMLVVYCLKNMDLSPGRFGIPEIAGVLLTVIVHKWKHNTLLSILCGTLLYMLLVQVVF